MSDLRPSLKSLVGCGLICVPIVKTLRFSGVRSRLGCHLRHRPRLIPCCYITLRIGCPGKTRSLIFGPDFLARFIFGLRSPCFVLGPILFKLSLSKQSMDFAVSENFYLFVCECALDSVWIVPQIYVLSIIMLILDSRISAGLDDCLRVAREMRGLEGLEVLLYETSD